MKHAQVEQVTPRARVHPKTRVSNDRLLKLAREACREQGGASQIGGRFYIVDTDIYEVKERAGGK